MSYGISICTGSTEISFPEDNYLQNLWAESAALETLQSKYGCDLVDFICWDCEDDEGVTFHDPLTIIQEIDKILGVLDSETDVDWGSYTEYSPEAFLEELGFLKKNLAEAVKHGIKISLGYC